MTGVQTCALPISRERLAVVSAIERVVEDGKALTRDLGGKASTVEAGRAIASLI